ncbi:leucine-rich repeat receptor-like serine/threonine-protein kinase RGI4 isoform X1 [Capsicum annuum]|uniref:leucine-rich repeat receptor-like serine/threonine-protein kinase RGI4 isoform X1 n=1 Tax=Capsicum annuum TaxID=4072 RepID=UPI001FB0CBE3|nr:leucine-rich repeat receptor-like serine/threonine-protein kinase RGI4 isoform X1 [Capsicum annuum]
MKLKYYLYHDCVPPIVHRDFKAQNLLLGNSYEPCLAYFGLARLVEEGNTSISANLQFARSYGYFAPGKRTQVPKPARTSMRNKSKSSVIIDGEFNETIEYACMLKITEKSDVFSFKVLFLEIITGKNPAYPSFPDSQHVIQWVCDHLKRKKDLVDVIDPRL